MVLPELLDQAAPGFSLANCRFGISKGKEPSNRVVLWRQFGIARSYTMESTYCGFDSGPYQGYQVGIRELQEMGRCLCETLLVLKRCVDSASILIVPDSEESSSDSALD
uniref:Uncharacterized protein n=1 Tax=Plectus sambesii TaxID=2011161 RepID=A0A914VEM7_9BILA